MNPVTPQSVTERYVSNLLSNGQNKEYSINALRRQTTLVNEDFVGYHWVVTVESATAVVNPAAASGATPAQAIRRALEKLGVTFR